MQVPSTITVNNGNSANNVRNNYNYYESATFAMDIPEKLTGKFIFIVYYQNF